MEQTQLQSGGKNRLVLKDLVNIAIFSVIYFVGLFVIGTPLGLLVVTYLAFPFAVSVVLGCFCLRKYKNRSVYSSLRPFPAAL